MCPAAGSNLGVLWGGWEEGGWADGSFGLDIGGILAA